MASTYTTSLQIQKIGTGEQSGVWGSTTNTNWDLIEQAVAGVRTITMANADYTLTVLNGTSDEARNAVLVVTGTNSGIFKVVIPAVTKTYVVTNNTTGGYAITVGTSSGASVTVPNGISVLVYCDATNTYSGVTGVTGGFSVPGNLSVTGNETVGGNLSVTGTTTFTGIPSGPTAAAGTNTTQLATTAFVTQNAVLTGALLMWATNTAPSGYLLCDGAAISRTTYAALYAVIGTTFGSGDGSTTFNVPNYTNRMPYGTTIGATGGSADAVLVSHTHTATSVVTDPGHNHEYIRDKDAGSLSSHQYSDSNAGYLNTTTSTTGITVATTNSTEGVSGTNANLPPYLGIKFIIKT